MEGVGGSILSAMEGVGGSILSACLDAVIDRLKSSDWLKYLDDKHLLEQLAKWEKMLETIYAVLDYAEETQTTRRSVEIWLTDLKHFTYDLEDVLDELEAEVQQQNSEDQDSRKRRHVEDESDGVRPSKRFKLISQAWKWVSSLPAVSSSCSKMDEISARFDEILSKKKLLNLHESNMRRITQANGRPPSTSLVNEAKIYGREKDKEAIFKLLEAIGHDADVAVIPIIGMGGVGKTTLAQLIYNDNSLQFDFKAWVCVGEDFDLLKITKTILQSIDDTGDKDKDLNSLQVKLKQKLSGKKWLIILDDVWSEKYDDWTLLCGPFEAGAPGSRIIITTRHQSVADMTAGTCTTTHKLKELSYDECLHVFCQHSSGTTDFDQHLHLKAIGEEIVKRCKGLPLAAKALGGLLRGKSNTNAWEEVLKSEIWDLPDNKSNILPALRLSYLHLPPPLKRCFAYCSIFPKDYEFGRNTLVLLWMAEGFLCQQNKVKRRDELGHEYFDELLSRSFFQQSFFGNKEGIFFQQSNNNKSRYVMHDLINDLAHFVSRDTCFHSVENDLEGEESYACIRHSSFIPLKYNVSRRFQCFYKMKKLRTFLSVKQPPYIETCLSRKVLYDLLPKLKCLRVVSLTGYDIEELPSSVGEMKQLRHLDLSSTNIKRLPKSIGKLFHLETLTLCHCGHLIELPKTVSNLTNLQHLDIRGTESLKEMPAQIGSLTSLFMLSKFIVGEGNDGLKISELKKLCQLAGTLLIEGLQNVGDIKEGNLIKEKPGLLKLYFSWDCFHTGENSNIQDEQTLKSLEPHRNASTILITGFRGRQLPSWVGDPIFSKMVTLWLSSCKHVKFLPPLGQLPSLKELNIQGLRGVEEVGTEFYADESSFPCLESLEIEDMSEWTKWSWCNALNEDSVGRFHKLRKFILRRCPKLVGKLPSFLPSLEELEISDCQQLTDLPRVLPSLKKLSIKGCPEAILRNLTNVSGLIEMEIGRIKGLSILDENFLQAMAALQNLKISECDELKYLWDDGTDLDYLTGLKHLKISSCKELESLVNVPGGFFPLNLENLNLSYCERLKGFPNGLNSLKYLDIQNCPSLEVLGYREMSSLETVEVGGCKSWSCSPYVKFSDSLKFLTIGKGAQQLLESFHYGFSHLRKLSIYGCDELESFPETEFPPISTLVSLSIFRCKRLKSLTNHMQSFHRLQSLSIFECHELDSFPERGLSNSSIGFLEIDTCSRLRYLPNHMQNLTSLQCLNIRKTEISSLEGCLPPNLCELEISGCKNLSQPMGEWGLHTLTFLRRLTISSNTDIVTFPDKGGLLLPMSLTYLNILRFKNVSSISRGIRNLNSLKELHISSCPKLKSLPVESLPPALEYLQIYECPHLKDWCSKDKGEYGPIISYTDCS